MRRRDTCMRLRNFISAGCRNNICTPWPQPDAACGQVRVKPDTTDDRRQLEPDPASAGGAIGVTTITVAALILCTLAARMFAEDWPAFRGPSGQGHSSEHNLPLEWDES
jgi:hypothetical protein